MGSPKMTLCPKPHLDAPMMALGVSEPHLGTSNVTLGAPKMALGVTKPLLGTLEVTLGAPNPIWVPPRWLFVL